MRWFILVMMVVGWVGFAAAQDLEVSGLDAPTGGVPAATENPATPVIAPSTALEMWLAQRDMRPPETSEWEWMRRGLGLSEGQFAGMLAQQLQNLVADPVEIGWSASRFMN
ncbi:MAG: hypothetical protein AB7K09_00610 [Planctomycetota bacterium]